MSGRGSRHRTRHGHNRRLALQQERKLLSLISARAKNDTAPASPHAFDQAKHDTRVKKLRVEQEARRRQKKAARERKRDLCCSNAQGGPTIP